MNARLSPVASSQITVKREQASDVSEMLSKLKSLLQQSFQLRQAGAPIREQAMAQGYADGYIASLIDSGLVEQSEVLGLIQATRRGSFGPLTSSPASKSHTDSSSAVMVA